MSTPELETLHDGRFLSLVRRGTWEFAARTKVTGVVGIVAVTTTGKIILTEQFRIPVNSYVIELPAGLAGDTPGSETEPLYLAAERELLEETGYQANTMTYLAHGPSSAGLTNEVTHLFLASGLTQVHAGGGVEGENIIVHEVPLTEVDAWLLNQQAAGRLVDFKVYTGLHFLKIGTPAHAERKA